jgi:hypothetical protein
MRQFYQSVDVRRAKIADKLHSYEVLAEMVQHLSQVGDLYLASNPDA